MTQLKHVGRIKNTGRRCIIAFREIYDELGNVVDGDHCLVFETDNLPDAEHQDLIRIIESEPAQATGDLYNILARTRLSNSVPALNWLVSTNRLRKEATSNVELTPDSTTQIRLDTINKIVKMQNTGASQEEIARVLQDDTDMPPRKATEALQVLDENETATPEPTAESQSGELLDDAALAKGRLNQAEMFEAQAKELREQAYELDPTLKPKSETASKKKTPAK